MSKLVSVKLKKHHGGCNPGETAGFPAHKAAALVKAGAAEYLTADIPEVPEDKAVASKPKGKARKTKGKGA